MFLSGILDEFFKYLKSVGPTLSDEVANILPELFFVDLFLHVVPEDVLKTFRVKFNLLVWTLFLEILE